MVENRKRGGRLLGSLGLALLSVLAFGAFAAQAATWHVGGKEFLGEELVEWSGGPVKFGPTSSGVSISCSSVSSEEAMISGGDEGAALGLGFSGCGVEGNSKCKVTSPWFNANIDATEVAGVGYLLFSPAEAGSFYKVTITGEGCSIAGQYPISGSFAGAVGHNSVKPTVTFSPLAEEAVEATGLKWLGSGYSPVSGSASMTLAGANAGQGFGTEASDFSPAWHIGGMEFPGEEAVAWSGGPIKLAKTGVTVVCNSVSSSGSLIFGADEGSGQLQLKKCELEKTPACEVVANSLSVHTQLVEAGGLVYEKFTPAGGGAFATWSIKDSGSEECYLVGSSALTGSFAAKVGLEAATPTFTFSSEADKAAGAEGIQWSLVGLLHSSGVAGLSLTGVNAGLTLGAW